MQELQGKGNTVMDPEQRRFCWGDGSIGDLRQAVITWEAQEVGEQSERQYISSEEEGCLTLSVDRNQGVG